MIGRDQIRDLVPHAGGMCLLDSVQAWDDASITCAARSHCDDGHPLRRNGRLSALHLIEYGAQAAAVHGSLLARRDGGRAAAPGVLTALRDCLLQVARIDDIDAPLTVGARRLIGSGGGWIYQFQISAQGRVLAQGRVSVMTPGLPA